MKKLAHPLASVLALAALFSVAQIQARAQAAAAPTAAAAPAAPADFKSDPSLDCVASSYQAGPTGVEHLILTNNCKQEVHVYYFVTPPNSGGTYLKPGKSENTHLTHDLITTTGGVGVYACPSGDIPVDATGKFSANKRDVPPFLCKHD